MKYSEKKKIEKFFVSILDKIDREKNSVAEVARIVHNSKIEVEEYLDKERL